MKMEQPSEGRVRVLHVEDDPLQQFCVAEMMKCLIETTSPRFTISLTAVDTAEKALEATQGGAAFEVVLLDYNLPDGDGVRSPMPHRARSPIPPPLAIALPSTTVTADGRPPQPSPLLMIRGHNCCSPVPTGHHPATTEEECGSVCGDHRAL